MSRMGRPGYEATLISSRAVTGISVHVAATPMSRHLDLDLLDAAHLPLHVRKIVLIRHWFA